MGTGGCFDGKREVGAADFCGICETLLTFAVLDWKIFSKKPSHVNHVSMGVERSDPKLIESLISCGNT